MDNETEEAETVSPDDEVEFDLDRALKDATEYKSQKKDPDW